MSGKDIKAIQVSETTEQNLAGAHVAGVFDMMTQWARMTALASFANTPLLDVLRRHGKIDAPKVIERENLVPRYTTGLLRYLVTQGLVTIADLEWACLDGQGGPRPAATRVP